MNNINSFNNSASFVKKSAKKINIRSDRLERIISPDRIILVSIPLVMDNGKIKVFQGYRVQFTGSRGPYKGGIRFHPQADLDKVKTLALLMALKCALINIPYGGGKGGIKVNPKKFSKKELKRLTQEFTRKIADFIGPDKDIVAPDVYTNPMIMDWIVEAYSKIKGKKIPSVATGKSIKKGGIPGRETATSLGGFFILKNTLKKLGILDSGLNVIIQGFGNVGYNLAKIFYDQGFYIVGLSDSKGGILTNNKTLKPVDVLKAKARKSMIDDCYYKGGLSTHDEKSHKHVSNKKILESTCDILIPSALENQITEKNAHRIKAKIILEMANSAVTSQASRILKKRGKIIIPDILANAGGVTVSYFEWLKDMKKEKWSEKKVFKRLESIMKKAFEETWKAVKTYKTDFKTAAIIVALKRIENSLIKNRG